MGCRLCSSPNRVTDVQVKVRNPLLGTAKFKYHKGNFTPQIESPRHSVHTEEDDLHRLILIN